MLGVVINSVTRSSGVLLGGSTVILVSASNKQLRLQSTSAHLGKHHSTRLWTPTRPRRPHGPRVTSKMTAHIGAGVACSAGPFWRPATAPRRFLALPHCPNRDAPLADHARARHRPPSPAPNHPKSVREHKRTAAKKARQQPLARWFCITRGWRPRLQRLLTPR